MRPPAAGAPAKFSPRPNVDDQVSRERLTVISDLYYLYQTEPPGVVRAVLKLQELFRAGAVRLSDGDGAMRLLRFDRQSMLCERGAACVEAFGYTGATPPQAHIYFETYPGDSVNQADDRSRSAESLGLQRAAIPLPRVGNVTPPRAARHPTA